MVRAWPMEMYGSSTGRPPIQVRRSMVAENSQKMIWVGG